MRAESGSIEIPALAKPDGGGSLGYGESFSLDTVTGAARFDIPLFLSAARGLTPQLTLRYSSSSANGLFGLGFTLELPSISRRTSLGIPRYTGRDQFVTETGDVLVPRYRRDGDAWWPVVRTVVDDGREYAVREYRRRIESSFDRIERWTDEADGRVFWRITDSDNVTTVYGRSADAQVADPADPRNVFRWMAQLRFDTKGNQVRFDYRRDDDGDRTAASLYPNQVRYGNFGQGDNEAFAFTLRFLYDGTTRPDPLVSFRAGFAIQTLQRCSGFVLSHYFPDELGPEPLDISRTELAYDVLGGASVLTRVTRTGLRQHGNGADASIEARALPPLTFAYPDLVSAPAFRPLSGQPGDEVPLPGLLPELPYRFVDLRGEGIPGILGDRANGAAPRYWPPLGDGRYAPGETVPVAPVLPLERPGRTALLDLDGDGMRDSVVLTPGHTGYFGNTGDGWSPFAPLSMSTTDLGQTSAAFVDLSGGGRVGLLESGPAGWRYSDSLGREGFDAPLNVPAPAGLSVYESDAGDAFIGFADLFGDGLSHLVRASSGSLTVWPSLGYGRFAPPRAIAGMPLLSPDTAASRLIFADLTGIGGADLIVLFADHVDIYLNHYGRKLTFWRSVTLPGDWSAIDGVQAADLLGTGASQLVLSYARQTPAIQQLDLCGGQLPFLMTSIDNGMGVQTRLAYRSSVEYWLKDKAAGKPWLTKLPFPVPVVEKIEQDDAISATRSVRVMQYAEGCFDPHDRQFVGFGSTQEQDDVTVDSAAWHFPVSTRDEYRALRSATESDASGEVKPSVEPLFNRTWQAVGDPSQAAALRARMLADAYPGLAETLVLPPPTLSPEFAAEPAASVALAYRALASRPLLMEQYGIDEHGSVKPVPYELSQQAHGVELIQPALGGHDAVVAVTTREAAATRFEQQPDDPFISHQLTVAFSEFLQPLRRAEIGYARRTAAARGVLPAQAAAQIRVTTSGVINRVDGAYRNANGGTTPPLRESASGAAHIAGLAFETQSFELAGFAPPAPYYSYEQAKAAVDAALAHVVQYGGAFSGDEPQARIFSWTRDYYADDSASGAAPLQRTGPQQLPRRQALAVFSDAFAAEVYGDRIDATYLARSAGYRRDEGYWWTDGLAASYADAAGFYTPVSYTDPFGAATAIRFDHYWLQIVRKTDASGASLVFEADYQALLPKRIVDENENSSEYLFDPLREVAVETRYGTEDGQRVGNAPLADYVPVAAESAEQVLADPRKYLQNASAFYYYDLAAWSETRRQPTFTIELFRRTFVYPEAGNDPADIGIRVRAFDGSQRALATTDLVTGSAPYSLAAPGHADAPRVHSRPLALATAEASGPAASTTQWVITGQQRYDNRGDVIVKYQPYFADTPAYEARPAAPKWTYAYDALHRLIHSETPDGFVTADEYRAWQSRHWDADDLVLESPYYQSRILDPGLPPAERAALQMAADFEDTPVTVARDVLGREIQQETILAAAERNRERLRNYRWFDAKDRLVAQSDARFYNPDNPQRPTFFNFFVRYDMLGHPASQKSADAGNLPLRSDADGIPWLRLFDALGHPLDEWDRRGVRHTIVYNALRLPISVTWRGDGLDCVGQRIVYGSDPNTNTVNRIIEHDDQAGIQRTALYSLLGDPVRHSRQYLVAAQGVADWGGSAAPPLQTTVWSWTTAANARGEPASYLAPNGCRVGTVHTFNGWPTKLDLTLVGADAKPRAVAEIRSFTPAGTPQQLDLGNGMSIFRDYYAESLRLRRISATKNTTIFQDVRYTYDPVGNVTNLENRLPPPGAPTEGPIDYVSRYDSLYRLLSATGLRAAADAPRTLEPYRRLYQYDAANNLLAVADDAGAAQSIAYTVSRSANHAVTQAMAEHGEPDAYFDADGFMTALPSGMQLRTNPEGRLAAATSPAGDITYAQYAYNRARLRKTLVAKDRDARETYYLEPFVAEGDPSAAASLLLSLGGGLVGSADFAAGSAGSVATLTFQVSDLLNSIVLRLNEVGAPLDYQEYYPYGATAFAVQPEAEPAPAKRIQFTGQERDPSTGLYSFPERYYAPDLAHWIAPDPAGTIDGTNLFAYVHGNPLTVTDPTGECGHDQGQQQRPAPGFFANIHKIALPGIQNIGLYTHALAEIGHGVSNIHLPPYELLLNNSPFKAAVSIKTLVLAGHGAIFSSVAGFGYHAGNLYKNGINVFDATSLVAQTLFGYQGIRTLRAITVRDHVALHHAHTSIGRIGFLADVLKAPYYLYKGEYDKVGLYAGFAAGNLRDAATFAQTERAYSALFRGVATVYNGAGGSHLPEFTAQAVASATRTFARVPGYAYIAFSLAAYTLAQPNSSDTH
ncbi:SpvB/TcaC N-terminal domain-containing protein [Burkholderia sp. MSHR3999]|uniref:SpvB/TcaC N-terminal domain-containing protein n=1 Tax=Burkholderia sp. MSHR3999 TaxID=1542965 RepID=UPI0005AC21B2|nr:SpvB/TcaC N-terminal domain-containing protein [Burkholderia sp. MSHR3999]